jgi:hypothetical protein
MGSSVFTDNETPLSAANLNTHVAGDGLANSGDVALGGASGLFWDDATQRLGRGTQSPAAALDWLDGTGALAAYLSTNADADVTLLFTGDRDANGAGARHAFVALDYSADVLKIGRGSDVDAATAYVALAPDGKVGVGLAPEAELHSLGQQYLDRYGSTPSCTMRRAAGTLGAPEATVSGDTIGTYAMLGHDGTAWTTMKARVSAQATEDFTPSAQGTRLDLWTTPNGSAVQARRVTVDHSGNVGLGTSAPGSVLELNLATADLEIVDAGTAGATEAAWVEIQVGNTPYFLRAFATK